MDALCLAVIASELRTLIMPSVVRKIYEMPGESFLINLWSGKEQWLLIALPGDSRRVHLVDEKETPSLVPSAFCMFLRKHMQGLSIIDIVQPDLERCLIFHLAAGKNSLRKGRKLVIEFLGKTGNIIVLDDEDRIMRHLHPLHPLRISPERDYCLPQKPLHKINPRDVTSRSLLREFMLSNDGALGSEEALCRSFFALTVAYAREIVLTADLRGDEKIADLHEEEWGALFNSWTRFWKRIDERRFKPVIFSESATDAASWGLWPYMEWATSPYREYPTVNDLMKDLFRSPAASPVLSERKSRLRSLALEEIRKLEKRQIAISRDLEKARENLPLKEMGELLLLNLGLIERGRTEVEVENIFAAHPEKIVLRIEPQLSPSENANRYFERFKKSRRAGPILTSRREETDREIAFWQAQLKTIERAESMEDLERLEPAERSDAPHPTRLAGQSSAARLPSHDLPSGPRRYVFKNCEILVGRNPRQNDEISLKIARGDDLWFHAQGMPSAHVILRCGGEKKSEHLPEEAILRAAALAAHYSRGKNSTKVPVIYTRAKYVKKTRHMSPGMVAISRERSIVVNPLDDEFLEWLGGQ